MTTSTTSPQPIERFAFGPIHVSVWSNTSKEGQVYYSARLERRYKDEQSGEYKTSNSFRPDQIPVAAELLTKASRRIDELRQQAKAA